jgi:hypothetical protein
MYVAEGKTVQIELLPAKDFVAGDYYFAVPHGEPPRNAQGFNKKGKKTWICGSSSENYQCADVKKLEAGYTRENSMFTHLPPGLLDVYIFKYLGKNEFGGDKGWKMLLKLNQYIFSDSCKDSDSYCSTYVKWGCDAKTSSGSVSSMCQKSCKKCTPTAPPTTINEPKTQTKASSTGGTTQPANEKTTKTSAENNQKAKDDGCRATRNPGPGFTVRIL